MWRRLSNLYYFISFRFLIKRLSGRLGDLDVVGLEIRLHVEDRELIALLHIEKLAKGRVRRDLVLVVEAVLLDVGTDGLRNLAAAHLIALATAEED